MSRSLRPVLLAPLVLVALTAAACGGDDGRSATAPAATAPEGSSPTTAAPSTPPANDGVVDTTPGGTKASVLAVLAGVETCWGTKASYARCDTPQAIEARGAHLVTRERPRPGEVAVTAATRDTFKIIGTDLAGTRYVLSKNRSGEIKRTCRLATGEACDIATW